MIKVISVTQSIHIAIEIWGALFCLVAILIVILTRHYNKEGALRLFLVMLCSAALMLCDSVSWIVRGRSAEFGDIILRYSYFGSLFFGFLLMPLSAEYVSHVLYKRTGGYRIYWSRVEWMIFFIGTFLLSLNEFFPYIYAISPRGDVDSMPVFHLLPSVIIMIGLLMTLCVAIVYIRYLLSIEKVAMISFLILPIVGVVMGIVFSQASYAKLAAVISTIILFVSYEVTYVQYLIDKEKQIAEDKLRVVNIQMQPHFIFNTLGLIRHLCRESPDEAVQVINEFSKVLRGTTDYLTESDCISVEKELELVRNYIKIQKRRFGDGLAVEYDLQDTDFDIPPFCVQTLVENAIRYGLKNGESKAGRIRISTQRTDGSHYLVIADNGVGFDPEILKDQRGNSVGIKNTMDRVAMMCNGVVTVESSKGSGTKVMIRIPV